MLGDIDGLLNKEVEYKGKLYYCLSRGLEIGSVVLIPLFECDISSTTVYYLDVKIVNCDIDLPSVGDIVNVKRNVEAFNGIITDIDAPFIYIDKFTDGFNVSKKIMYNSIYKNFGNEELNIIEDKYPEYFI